MIRKAHFLKRGSHPAFTLAEIAITLGIVAGTALLVLALFSTLTKNVQRLKEVEAPIRPAKTINPTINQPNHPLPDDDELVTRPPDRPPQ